MKELIGNDLAGWRIEIWYEVMVDIPVDEHRHWGPIIAGYFSDRKLAVASRKKNIRYKRDGKITKVHVLTKDGPTGYVIEIGKKKVKLSQQVRRIAG